MTFRTEQESLVALLTAARAAGAHSFRVHDGEEWAHDLTQYDIGVISASNSTGQDALYCYATDGTRLGRFHLVWGNCPQGSDLVSDYGVNPFTDAVFDAWFSASEA